MPQRTHWGIVVVVTGLMPFVTQPVKSEQPGGTAAGETNDELQEIVVTAQKRGEVLQDVPLSITAIQPSSLQEAGVDMSKALAALTPNLTVDFNANFVAPYIRGVGTQYANPGLESSVAMYIDDLYLSRASAGLLSFNDVQRVEVLEGPQGTLYGMNTTGGAIRIITKDPTSEFHAGAGFTVGNYDTLGGDAYVNGQIAPGLNGRLAAQYEHNNGYVNDVTPGAPRLENRNMGMVRGKLYWDVNDQLSVKLMFDYEQKKDHEGQAFLSLYPGAPEVSSALLGGVPSPGFYTASSNYTNAQKMFLRIGGTELRIDYDFDAFRFSSISGFRFDQFSGYADLDTTSLPLLNASTVLELTRDWSQEFQAVSSGAGPLKWVAGLFYLHETGSDNFGLGGLGIDAGTGIPGSFTGGYGQEAQDMLAPYGQVSFQITPKWEVLVGARYSSQQVRLVNNQFYVTTAPNGWDPVSPYLSSVISPGQQFNSNTLAPKFEITWRPVSGVMLYASYTKAYKSGGFNLPQPSPTPPQAIQDEVLKAAEFGWKTEFGPLRFNGAYFHYNENDLQVQSTNISTGITTVKNAATATTDGFESALDVVAARGLVVGANIGYLSAKFDSFPGGQINVPCALNPATSGCGGTPVGVGTEIADLADRRLPYSPRWTGNIHGEYSYTLPNQLGAMKLAATESYTSLYYFTADNVYKQPSVALLSASAGWTSSDSHYSVRIYGTNLTDKEYLSHVAPFSAGGWKVPAPPREFGARLAYDY